MPYILAIVAGLWWFEAWPFSVSGPLDFQTEYMPEVGYYKDGGVVWYVGERMKDSRKCVDEAIYASRRLTNLTPSRVTSIACRVMRGDRFLDRVK